ncbi:MAG TPA: aminotransferase class V-fold PLP-dependent enzyme, partial [Myxococcales bacterium]|nr:aminotransferase class V-fold PLP-dependent enzyme [Myxococcales bacterium]
RNGDPERCVAGTINLSFADHEGETLLMALDLAGVSVSTGSACTAGSLEPSHVLLAMGLSEEQASSALRFSLGVGNNIQQIAETLKILTAILNRAQPEARALP